MILCKTSLDPVRTAWSGFGQVHLVWKQTSPDPVWFWLTVSGFGQTDLVQKQADVQKSLAYFGQCLSAQIQHAYWARHSQKTAYLNIV